MPVGFYGTGSVAGTQVPYTPQVPINQVSLHVDLEQSELIRLQRIAEAQRFYFGRHWDFSRESGDPLQTHNYVRKFVDKHVSFLTKRGFGVNTPRPLSKVTLPYLMRVWRKNRGGLFFREAAHNAALTGDAFALVTYRPYSKSEQSMDPRYRGYVKVTLLKSEYVFPTWDPLDKDRIVSVRIEHLFYDKNPARDRINGNPQGMGSGMSGIRIRRFTQIITEDLITESFDGEAPKSRPNILGIVPIVHIPNISVPGEFYGLSDLDGLIDVQRGINEVATDIADVVNYQASPVTAIFGARAKNLERGAKNVWSGLPTDARIQTIELGGALGPMNQQYATLKETLHELGDMPEGALGKQMPVSNTSGVAMGMMLLPLTENRDMKLLTFIPGLQEINSLALRIGAAMGEVAIFHDLCEHCGGRIVEYEDPSDTAVEWVDDPMDPVNGGFYKDVPKKKKKCYHVDPITLEFVQPAEMRVKFRREYGFGSEIREAPLALVERMVKSGKPSYWDYTADLLTKIQEARKAREEARQKAMQPQESEIDPETGQPVPAAPPPLPEIPDRTMTLLPPGEMEIPEEPEDVVLTFPLLHPVTGRVVEQRTVKMQLVPTGCVEPSYLDPYKTDVSVPDPLPKDEQLEAGLYTQYLQAGLVDAEFVRRQIPNIAPFADEIEKRMKKATKTAEAAPQEQIAGTPETGSAQSEGQAPEQTG